jgi:hypothetical protein
MSVEAMKQALEALRCIESPLHVWEINKIGGAMNALRQAIEQAEMIEKSTKAWADTPDHFRDATKKVVPSNYSNSHQPVAWAKFNQGEITHSEMTDGSGCDFDLKAAGFVPLYTAPITRQENRQVAKNATTGNQEVAKSATTDWEAVAADQAMTIAMLKLEQKREWVGLTDHELQVLDFNDPERGKLARAVEAKLKERNI